MKRISIIMAMMLALAVSAAAHRNQGEDWREKMMSEKIAFLTAELGITPEEAQTFWPLYNEIEKEKDEAMRNVFKTFKELKAASEEGKSEKELSKLLDNYLEALENQKDTDKKAIEKYRKALPVGKLAKLYIGEEKFRRQHIRRMHHKPGEKSGQHPGPKPGPQRQ